MGRLPEKAEYILRGHTINFAVSEESGEPMYIGVRYDGSDEETGWEKRSPTPFTVSDNYLKRVEIEIMRPNHYNKITVTPRFDINLNPALIEDDLNRSYDIQSRYGETSHDYIVNRRDGVWFCNCPDSVQRNKECKHIARVIEFEQGFLVNQAEADRLESQIKVLQEQLRELTKNRQ